MAAACQSIAETVDFVVGRRPVLEPMLRSFIPLFEARDTVAAQLESELEKSGLALPPFGDDKGGVPLLARENLNGLGTIIGMAADRLLPLLVKFDAISPYGQALESFFLPKAGRPDDREALAQAIFGDSPRTVARIAQDHGVPPQIMDFALAFILSSALRSLVRLALRGREESPWDGEGAWQHGFCPVCGLYPSLAWLDRRSFDEKNAFLSGGGGKKHFHCSMCGANWKFRRAVCPACGREGDGAMSILKEENSLGERLEVCNECNVYCPTTDLRELEHIPNMDVMALGMTHLDMVAAERGLLPIRETFWNMFNI